MLETHNSQRPRPSAGAPRRTMCVEAKSRLARHGLVGAGKVDLPIPEAAGPNQHTARLLAAALH